MPEKKFIESLHQEKAKNDSNSHDLANTLNILSKTVFGEVNRFVFELLQNADDSPNTTGKADVDVEFRLLQNHLIFKHSGAHFTNNDVTGISRVGSRESKKDMDIQKTGYKGIGFKSVFGSSDRVHIVSNKFSFRFDKNYELWKERKDYPWQVIPIWTDEVPLETKKFVDNRMVNTIISISNKAKINEEISNIFKDCQIVLFLRNIRSVSFYVDNSCSFKIEKKEAEGGNRELIKNGKIESAWLIKDFFVQVDDDLRSKLKSLSDEECPRKLKEAEVAKVTLAAYVKDGRISQVTNALMYCYLPTKVNKGFPYIINADFITNAERTQFLVNDWNSFLLKQIAIKQFEWISELQTSNLKYQFTILIKQKFGGYPMPEIEKSFNSGFDIAIHNISFIPQPDSNELLKISEALIDSTFFSSSFDSKLIIDYLSSKKKIADSKIEYSNVLIEIGCEEFEINGLTSLFNSNKFNVGEKNLYSEVINLVQFFKLQTDNNKNPGWLPLLKKTKFLIDQENAFETPKEVYFPLSEKKKEAGEFLDLRFLNENVYNYFENDIETLKWLHDLGLKEPSATEIVRKSIVKMIDENKISEANAVQVAKFIFKVYKSGKLADKDYTLLKNLKILTKNGLKTAKDCYLPSEFDPELKIDSVLTNANFISNLYCEDESLRLDWKQLLIKLGVREKISMVVNTQPLERTSFISLDKKYLGYFEWLDKNRFYPDLYYNYRNTKQHGVIDFVYVDFIEQTHIHTFSKAFWKMVFENWTDFYAKCNAITYYYFRNGSNLVPSYIRYYVQAHKSIPATDGKCYSALEVYTPNLKTIIGTHFPVADFDSKINREQVEFFGLKSQISFLHCFEILASLESKVVDSELNKQIFAIYEQMIKTKSDITEEEIQDIRTWRKKGKLLALNNGFQNVTSLFCFLVNGFTAPVSSENFIKLPVDMKYQEVEAFCSLFEIPLVSYDKLEFVAEKITQEMGLHSTLKAKAKYFSIISAHINSIDVNTVFENLFEKVDSTTFFITESLSLVYRTEKGNVIFNSNIETWFDHKGSFYYVGKWNSPLTLYSLSGSLCEFLGLKNLERELALILQLEDEEIQSWLVEKGYSIPDISIEVKENFTKPNAETIETESKLEGKLEVEEFIPEIMAKDVDVSKVKTERKIAESINLNPEEKSSEISNPQARLDIGRWSEELVFNYLKKTPSLHIKVIWENENGESGKPYDFMVIENEVEKFIEVKGTPSNSKEIIYISTNEWKFMFEKGVNYSIYRLFNVGQEDNLRMEILDNPAELVKKAVIIPNPIRLQV